LRVYADTGFLVSLYGEDDLSDAATALVRPGVTLVLTPLGEAEFANALQLRIFRRQWTLAEARAVHDRFRFHVAAGVFHLEELGQEMWSLAMSLSRRHSAKLGTRTLDVLHVASVLILKPDAFLTFDERQRKFARAEGLRVLPTRARKR